MLLAALQGCLIGLNFMKAPANFRRFLSGHPAMLVEFHWVARHDRLPFLSLGAMGCVRVQRVDDEIAAQPPHVGITAGRAFSEYRGVPRYRGPCKRPPAGKDPRNDRSLQQTIRGQDSLTSA